MPKRTWNTPVPKPHEPTYVWFKDVVVKVKSLLYHEEGTYCLQGEDANGIPYKNIYQNEFEEAFKEDFLIQKLV